MRIRSATRAVKWPENVHDGASRAVPLRRGSVARHERRRRGIPVAHGVSRGIVEYIESVSPGGATSCQALCRPSGARDVFRGDSPTQGSRLGLHRSRRSAASPIAARRPTTWPRIPTSEFRAGPEFRAQGGTQLAPAANAARFVAASQVRYQSVSRAAPLKR